jgi:signal transduction histidine kinase
MKTKDRPDPKADIKRWSKQSLAVLLALLVCLPLAGYGWVVVRSTYTLRLQTAQERNLSTAQLIARLLGEQAETTISVLRELSKRQLLHQALEEKSPQGIRRHLRDAVDTLPDLVYAAAYDSDGTLLTSYPDVRGIPYRRIPAYWVTILSQKDTLINVVRPGGTAAALPEVMELVMPVGTGSRPSGYLLVQYQLRETREWLRQVRIPGGTVVVADSNGAVIAASSETASVPQNVRHYPGFLSATKGVSRVLTDPAGGGGDARLISWAFVERSQWVVLVIQPLAVSVAPIERLVRSMLLIAVPVVVLMLGGAGLISRLNWQQERMARQLADQNERLRVADRMKSDFLANVSHDLRTPLSSLKMTVSGLLDPEVAWTPEQVRGCLEVADQELDLMAGRVRNLLVIARLEAKIAALRKEATDLAGIVTSALSRLGPLLRHHPIEDGLPPEPLLADCDPAEIETVVINLVENAAKYTPPGSVIQVSAQRRDGSVFVFVRDSGPGIPPGDEERIFEKFYRAASAPSTKGTGLGLAICKAIIEAHGGGIGMRNRAEGGAEFWFSLPTLDEGNHGG